MNAGFYAARLLQYLDPVYTLTESEHQQPNQHSLVSPDDSDMRVHDLEEEIEGMRVNTVRVPTKPSQSESEAHMATHWPYSCGCPHCVRGIGQSSAFPSGRASASNIPIVSIY